MKQRYFSIRLPVSRVLSWMTIYLVSRLLVRSSGFSGRRGGTTLIASLLAADRVYLLAMSP